MISQNINADLKGPKVKYKLQYGRIIPIFTINYVRCKLWDHFCMEMFPLHYENTPMQYTAIFHGCKNGNFRVTKFYIFLIFDKNIDCGYTLESPQ